MNSGSGAPYDESYKQLFSHPKMVEDLLRDFVPEDWVAGLDFSTLERCSGSYVSDDLRERHDDIIWRIKHCDSSHGESWCYIYLLLEFQSQVDPWMALRIMVYVGLLYQDLIKSGVVTAGELLPPVFPLVLYNGMQPWNAALDVADLIMKLTPGLSRHIPHLGFFLLEEAGISKDALRNADGLAGTLLRLERSTCPADMRAGVQELIEKLRSKEYISLRRAFTVFIGRALLQRLTPKAPLPEVANLQEVDAMLEERVAQWAEEWKQQGLLAGKEQGLQEGREKGLLEGRMEGRMEGQSELLQRQLRKRFGEVADREDVLTRLKQASCEQLDLWAERILDARTLEEIFKE